MRMSSIAAGLAALGLAALGCGGGGSAPAPANGGPPATDGGSIAGVPDAGSSNDAGATPPPHVLTVERSGSGTVRSLPAGIDCGASCAFLFPDGTAVLLTAAPATGWKFAGWAGACGGVSTCSLTLRAETTVWATFEAEAPAPGHHFLSVARAGTGTGRVTSSPAGVDCGSSCGALFDEKAVVSLSAIPDPGSKFSGWTGDCAGVAACSLSMTADRSVSATFDLLPPPDECAGLRPSDPGAAPNGTLQSFLPADGGVSCRQGYVAGSGILALPVDAADTSSTVFFSRSNGEPLSKAMGGHIELTEQLEGFVAQYSVPPPPAAQTPLAYSLAAFNSAGMPYNPVLANTSNMLEDPTGGVVVVQPQGTAASLQSYDAQLNLRWSLQLPQTAVPLRVDRAGNTLVLWDGTPLYGANTVGAFWVNRAGTRSLVSFQLPGATTVQGVVAATRVVSGLFLANGGLWTLQLDSLSTTPAPAPPWLAARPVLDMHTVRGGRGYALLPPPLAGPIGPCAQEIEILAPSGKSCGTSLFKAADGACRPLGIRIGYDGTVVQQLPSDQENRCPDGVAQCSCTWHWWPGFFR